VSGLHPREKRGPETQLATDDEIIIFDDGSTDDIVQAIKGMKNKRIRLFSNPKGK